jgi:cell division initiation protein
MELTPKLLREAEFREGLRGYKCDDVDEFLEQVAQGVEQLQEQLRQANELIKQLELNAAQPALSQGSPDALQIDALQIGEETLRRTLVLAQKTADDAIKDAQERAAAMVQTADEQAKGIVGQAESEAARITETTRKALREEIDKLQGARGLLTGEIEIMSKHLEGERLRLRTMLGEMLKWVEDNIQQRPVPQLKASPPPASPPSASPPSASPPSANPPPANPPSARDNIPDSPDFMQVEQ